MQKLYFLLAALCCSYFNSLNAQVEIRNELTANHLYATEEMVEEENTITTSSFTPLNYCAGSTISIPFTVNGIFGHTNIFTAQLSDFTGSFSNPINIGTINGTGNGSISSVIPANTVFGTHYRIRVVSNFPMVTGTDNGIDLIMMPVPQFNLVPETYCDNDATTYVLGTFSISNYGFISVGTGGDLVDLGGGLKRIEFKPQGKFGLVSFEVRLGECFHTFNFTVNRAVVFANNSTTHLACASEGVDLTTAYVSSPIPTGTTFQYLFSGLPVGNPTSVKATGDYTVIATTPEGCVSQTTVHVFIMPIPVFNLIPATYCDNDATTYVLGTFSITDYGFISVGTGGDMVDLGGGLKRIEFKPQGKFGLVSFEVRLGECFHTFNFIVNRAVVFANNSTPLLACASEGVNLTTAFVSSPIPTGTTFQYLFDGLPVSNPVAVNVTGDYTIIATTPEGCPSQTTVHVFIMPVPVFNVVPQAYCENDQNTYALGTFSSADYGLISVGAGGEKVDLGGGFFRIEFRPAGKSGLVSFQVRLGECFHTFNFVVNRTVIIASDPFTKLACASEGFNLTTSYYTFPATPPAGTVIKHFFNDLPVANPQAVTVTGDYTIVATTAEGCSYQTIVHVYIMPVPVFNIVPDSYCGMDAATYVLGTFSSSVYGLISVGTGGEKVDLGGGLYRIEFKPLGKYGPVSFELRLGECYHTLNFTVNHSVEFASNPITLSACAAQGVNLTTSFVTIPATPPDGTTFQYLLNGITVLNPLVVSSGGIYTIVATTPEGCSSEKNITVNILPTPVLEPIPDHYCSNDNQTYLLGSFQRQNFAAVIGPGMSLTNFGGLISFNFRPAVVPPGTYTIGANVDGCTATKSITIDPSPVLVLNTSLLSVCSPGTVNLTTVLNENASTLPAGTSFQYRFGATDVSDPAAAGVSGIYTIVATTSEGCSSEKNITVNILPTPVLEPIPDHFCSNDNQTYLLGSFQRQNFAAVIGPGMSLTNFGGLISFNFRPAVVPPGTYTIGANVDGCTSTKEVTINPAITITGCSLDIVVNTKPGLCGAIVNFNPPTATGCIASIIQTSGLPTGSVFPVGTSTVSYSVNPVSGSPFICSFTVTVNDTEDPLISNMPSNISQINDPGKCYATVSWNLPVVTDNCPGSVLFSTYHPGDHFPVGTTSVFYVATDIHGNSISKTFTITVTEDEKPDIDGILLKVYCHDLSNQYPGPQINVNDNCGIQNSSFTIIGSTTRSGSGNNAAGLFNPGLSLVKWTVSDLNGNVSYWITLVVVIPPINVSIPDAYSMEDGVDPNTVYIGYAPAASINLKVLASGGTGGFTYLWNTGSTASNITVSPIVNTIYTVTVTDISGCSRTQTKQVNVVDVRCGNGLIRLCAKTGNPASYNNICVAQNQVKNYIKHNYAYLGACQTMMTRMEKQPVRETIGEEALTITAFPNPSKAFFRLNIRSSNIKEKMQLTIYNALGKVVEIKILQPNILLELGALYRPGIYFAELKQGNRTVSIKLIKGSD